MPTALFADADRESRDLHAWLLSSYGFQVDTASNGLQCLAKLSHSLPDLLILDLELPWGGGDGVLALIRQDLRLLPSRVVLTSSGRSGQ
jgi:CheY-like chemotaxis protein